MLVSYVRNSGHLGCISERDTPPSKPCKVCKFRKVVSYKEVLWQR